MLKIIKLLLPALIPSWRFFDVIAPSPRIELTLLKTVNDIPDNWLEFRPRPLHLSFSHMLKRLFWNPLWNETLFLVSCSERLIDTPTQHSEQQIISCIKAEFKKRNSNGMATPYFQFRLVFVSRQGEELQKHVKFVSPVYRHSGHTIL